MVKVKICGLCRLQDIEAVNRALPDYIGFVFADSRRRIDAETAAMLKNSLDPRIKAVGVFVNASLETVQKIYQGGIIDLAQLHGDEDRSYIRRFKENCGCPVIKAVGIGNRMPPLPDGADYLLFDTLSPKRGGTGRPFDWNILKEYRDLPYFLAGGLTADNAAGALRLISPYCADVSGGVETDGLKDPEKIEKFVQTLRRQNVPPMQPKEVLNK